MGKCFRPGGIELTKELIQIGKLPNKGNILDLGCGDGTTVEYLISLGYEAKGIDKEMAAPDNRQLQQGDMLQLLIGDGQLDAVLSECSFSVCGNTEKALMEASRVLKIGGKLLFSDVFFTGMDVPSLSLGLPATTENWRKIIIDAGFKILETKDYTHLWKHFLVQAIWNGIEVEQIWCGAKQTRVNYKTGYALWYAVKL